MRYFVIVLFLSVGASLSAETTNSLRLKNAKAEAQQLSENIQKGQENLLRLEGVILTLQAIVDEETTSTQSSDAITTK